MLYLLGFNPVHRGVRLKKIVTTRKPASERKRRADEAVSYAVGNGIRLEALAILAEGEYSASQIAKMLGLDTQVVNNHLRELMACGCIEPTKTTTVRNATQRFFRALATPHVSDKAYKKMSVEARREVITVLVQGIVAETLASLRAEKMETDDDVALMWDCVSADKQGRREISAKIQTLFDEIVEIGDESEERMAKSGESAVTTVVSLTAFERSRPGRPEKLSAYPPEPS
jgi:DNA-binding transcriptional ArsR family regulator